LDPSWFARGQTTSLLASKAENELVREDRGGMAWRMKAGLAERQWEQRHQVRSNQLSGVWKLDSVILSRIKVN